MDTSEVKGRMWADLLTSELAARSAQHVVTRRAETYIYAGLPLDDVLDALKISRATWYRRVEAVRAWEADNSAAGKRMLVEDQAVEALAAAIEGE
jgi:hypothetical protein